MVQFLETIVDPVAAALRSAPFDDEPEADEEKAAVSEHANGSGRTEARVFRMRKRCGVWDSSKWRCPDKGIARRVKQAAERFADTGAGNVKRLQAIDPPEFRLRVDDYRVRFN